MPGASLYRIVRVVSMVVILLMAVAILYAGGISIAYWSGIGV